MSHEFGFDGELSYRYRAPEKIVKKGKFPWEGRDCPICGTRLYHAWHSHVVLMRHWRTGEVRGVHNSCKNHEWKLYDKEMPARDRYRQLWPFKDSKTWIAALEKQNGRETTNDG